MSASDPVKAASSTAKQAPADMEVEAGEVDAKGAHLLRPEAPEFKPGTDSAAAPAAATAAGPKRKETEHASPAQVSSPAGQVSADYALCVQCPPTEGSKHKLVHAMKNDMCYTLAGQGAGCKAAVREGRAGQQAAQGGHRGTALVCLPLIFSGL